MEDKANYSSVPADVLAKVLRALDGMQYGEIIIKVQAGKVTVIDKIERERVS